MKGDCCTYLFYENEFKCGTLSADFQIDAALVTVPTEYKKFSFTFCLSIIRTNNTIPLSSSLPWIGY